ncbi:hypothetical protein [Sulfitobacter sp. 1A15299]|uniref:hypothetical protein n=1 Tax=Sulfitobacter sp. 1A15299 TaxID=3368598 RepID=UPI0037484254
MKTNLKANQFFRAENGAVTVEWVFLAAALVGLTALTLATIETTTLDTTAKTATKISTMGSVD